MTTETAINEFRHLEITPLTPNIGGMIENANLSKLNEDATEELRSALWKFGVLIARDQNLSVQEQKNVALIFADKLEKHSYGPSLADEGHPDVHRVEMYPSGRAQTSTDIWHQDVTGRKHPNFVNVIQAKVVPFGADTMWASAKLGYEWLPFELRQLFLSIDVEHDTVYGVLRHDIGDDSVDVKKLLEFDENTTRPAVINHPITGELVMFVNNAWTKRVSGYNADLSEAILRIAFDIPKKPELQVRHQWQPGDIAIWDNLATWHYGVTADLRDKPRLLHRVGAWSESIELTLDRERALRNLRESQA